MKAKASKSKKLGSKRKLKTTLGRNSDMPEGIFGIVDDVSRGFKLEALSLSSNTDLHGSSSTGARPKANKSKRRERRNAPEVSVAASLENNVYADSVPDLDYENAIKVDESYVRRVQATGDKRTSDLTDLILSRHLPTAMAIDAAQNVSKTVAKDTLGIDLDMDTSIFEALKAVSNMDLIFYMLKKSSLPFKLKRRYMRAVVEQSATATLEAMKVSATRTDKERKFADLRSLVVRRQSDLLRDEVRNRKTRSRVAETENDSPFGIVNQDTRAPSSNLGTMRSRKSLRR